MSRKHNGFKSEYNTLVILCHIRGSWAGCLYFIIGLQPNDIIYIIIILIIKKKKKRKGKENMLASHGRYEMQTCEISRTKPRAKRTNAQFSRQCPTSLKENTIKMRLGILLVVVM